MTMPQPNDVAQWYKVEVTQKSSTLGLMEGGRIIFTPVVWEGRATCLTDAYVQARAFVNPRLDWRQFTCKLLERRD